MAQHRTATPSPAWDVYHPYGYSPGQPRYWIGMNGVSTRGRTTSRSRSPAGGLNVPKLSLHDLSGYPAGTATRYVTSVQVNASPTRISPTKDAMTKIPVRAGTPHSPSPRLRPNGYIPYASSPHTVSTSRLEDSRSTNQSKSGEKKPETLRRGEKLHGRGRVTINKPIVVQCPKHFGAGPSITKNLVSLGLLFLGAILLAGLALQLMYKIRDESSDAIAPWTSLSNTDHVLFVQVCVVALYAVVTLDVVCVLVCALQFVCVVRILLETSQGPARHALKSFFSFISQTFR